MAVIPLTVVELRLQIRQLLLGSVKTFTFLVGGVVSAPDMVQICAYLCEHMRPPLIAGVAGVTVVIPILRSRTQSKEHQGHQHCHNSLLHNRNSPFRFTYFNCVPCGRDVLTVPGLLHLLPPAGLMGISYGRLLGK